MGLGRQWVGQSLRGSGPVGAAVQDQRRDLQGGQFRSQIGASEGLVRLEFLVPK